MEFAVRSREENLARLRSARLDIAPGQKFTVKDFDPEDAQGIAALYYAVYGENFAVDYVYDPEQIIVAHERKETHCVIGRTEAGDVVGLYALFRNPPGKRIMEAGAWIVLPEYRNSTLAMRLAARIHGNPPAHLGLDVIFGQVVCDHVITQKMGAKYKAFSCALELEAMPPRPDDVQGRSGGRITLLDTFALLRDVPHAVYLPVVYAGSLCGLYASCGLSREFLEDGPPQAETRCGLETMDAASLVRMTVHEVGRDLGDRLEELERDYPDRQIAHLILPLWRPGASAAVEIARKAGYFLGGLLPFWDDRDMLLMQKLRTLPDYSRILLYTQEAKDLLDLVVRDRASLSA